MCWVDWPFLGRTFWICVWQVPEWYLWSGTILMLLAFLWKIPIQWGCVSFISTPTHRTGVEFLFFTKTKFVLFAFSLPDLCKKKKKKKLLSCVSWPEVEFFLNHFPQGPHFSRVLNFWLSSLQQNHISKPIWHSWMLLKLSGSWAGIKSSSLQYPGLSSV